MARTNCSDQCGDIRSNPRASAIGCAIAQNIGSWVRLRYRWKLYKDVGYLPLCSYYISISISTSISRCSNLAVSFLKSIYTATNHGAAATLLDLWLKENHTHRLQRLPHTSVVKGVLLVSFLPSNYMYITKLMYKNSSIWGSLCMYIK